MKKTIFITLITAAAFMFHGCQEAETPNHFISVELEPTMNILDFKALCVGNTYYVDSDIIIVGDVISSDAEGNVYRSFWIQDESSGIEIMEGTRYGMTKKYRVGQRISIKAKGLTLGMTYGVPRLGFHTTGYANTWLDTPYLIKQTIFRGDIHPLGTPAVITSRDDLIKDETVGTLVTVKGITYVSGNTQTTDHPYNTWAIPSDPGNPDLDPGYGEQTFTFGGGANDTFVVRTSGYARFAGNELPFEANAQVEITGIVTRFNGSPQIVLNTDRDVIVVD